MTGRPSARVVLVEAENEPHGDSVAPRLVDLLEHGWDAHVLRDASTSSVAAQSGELAADVNRHRVHPPPLELRRSAPRPGLVTGALVAAARRPAAMARALWSAPDGLARYQRGVLLALDPALVHFGSVEAARRQAPVLAALRARIVVSVGENAPEPLDPIVLAADGLHVESDALAKVVRSQGLPDGALVAVIPSWHDDRATREPAKLRRAGDGFRILSVGPLSWDQGYEYALQAVALLAARGIACRYRIVGRGAFADAVAFARHQLGIERLVDIVEPGDRRALLEELAWADTLVSAAVAGGLRSRTLRDAQATSLPVVRTEPPSDGTDTALTVPRRDAEALADRLASLAADPGLRHRLADAGRPVAGATITADERLALFRALYDRVAGDQDRKR